MDIRISNKKLIGINSLGRIGKLVLWNLLVSKLYDGVVINLGRTAGKKPEDILDFLSTDSTYGSLTHFLYGQTGRKAELKVVDAATGMYEIEGFPVKILFRERNPLHINWTAENIPVVIDCSGQFVDPSVPADSAKGSLRGHLEGGARKVIISAPFKVKDTAGKIPDDSVMMVYGVNHLNFLPEKHHIISAASCTTTALSHMMKPLIESEATANILTASMSTVHAATNTQSVLDSVPSAGTSDLRKNRSVFNNIILSTTGAAKALEEILPQIREIGFMADSVRIPTNTVSLISLNITFASQIDLHGEPTISRQIINDLFKQAAKGPQKDMLIYSSRQNVSSDLMGLNAAVVIEGHETHTRTGFLKLGGSMLAEYGVNKQQQISIPVTHVKIFGWYDNEYGSYVNMLTRLCQYIYSSL
jgi:glyceraldehyde 3-phosphate dehydrogenase